MRRLRWLLWDLLHPIRAWGPRCAIDPPWRLTDAGPCIAPAGHHDPDDHGEVWHADGTGYIWTRTRWGWRGPDTPGTLHLDPFTTYPLFTEHPQEPTP